MSDLHISGEGQNILNILQEYEAEFGPSDQSEGGDKDEAEVIILVCKRC